MNKVVFLDRDGTINVDYGYVYKIDDFHFIDGAIEALRELNQLGYLLIVISNQSGIARGYYTLEDANLIFDYMVNTLKEEGVKIQKYYYCPHSDQDHCTCRKPKLDLFKEAIQEFDIDLTKSYAIGDKVRDLSICDVSDVTGILLDENKNMESTGYIRKKNLLDAVKYIKENS